MVSLKPHKLIKICNELILKQNTKKYLLAFSGGQDSSIILDCFIKISKKCDIKVRSIHINHGLNNQSEKYAKHCAEISKSYGINHKTITINVNGTSNLEEKCRVERYKALVNNCSSDEYIVTGHHEDDQIETFFLRLMRGSGIRGLSCMKTKSKYQNRTIFRPLIQTPKSLLNEYINYYNLSYIEDETNIDCKYDRNFLRHKVLPVFKERWKSMNKNISNNIYVQEIYSRFINDNIDFFLSRYLDENNNILITVLKKEKLHTILIILHEWVYKKSSILLTVKQITELVKIMNTNNDSNPLFEFSTIRITKQKNILKLDLF
ncbi:MAG: tRNA lysidine(34) synthetase TilS [Gammaproteobacteria bacterium]|nr:tRNA lysidine(34) synthetase TilS [Gammaproteobacteria bacterium]